MQELGKEKIDLPRMFLLIGDLICRKIGTYVRDRNSFRTLKTNSATPKAIVPTPFSNPIEAFLAQSSYPGIPHRIAKERGVLKQNAAGFSPKTRQATPLPCPAGAAFPNFEERGPRAVPSKKCARLRAFEAPARHRCQPVPAKTSSATNSSSTTSCQCLAS
jgi:hypothetical protein